MAQRRRGVELEQALLDAAWDELTDNGYAGFTMDAVVKRAGTSPPVLYRRWPDRDELIRATIVNVLKQSRPAVPDTGSLREDLLAVMREIATEHVELVAVMSAHVANYYRETGRSPSSLFDPVTTGRAAALDLLFERGVDRGEIRSELLTERIKALPFVLLRHEILSTFAPVPDRVLEEIVDRIFLPLVRLPW